ncbi:M24 family metallopeptidase [Aggregatilinea lenta]|uniref:M24 family metallopeptidase n=1 Tax=Aggregatilinea lenta TaxID=913108 RepID=UPI000E5A5FCF|nr:Xaa-Pro peptidase family protein [Aggregatilinea lenta]
MKSDLDRFMHERGIDALLILADETPDPYRTYLANGANTSAMAIKKRGEPPVLVANGMEIDEAAQSGLKVYNVEDFGYSELTREHGYFNDAFRAAWFRRVFEELDVRGKLCVYGMGDLNAALTTLRVLSQDLGDRVELVTDDVRSNVFDRAYETKDADELETLRDVARRTSEVACAVRDWIAGHGVEGDTIVTADGSPLTIGDVKQYLHVQLAERNLEDGGVTIFAQGRDAGVPHSRGESEQAVRLGQSIVFDLFPREPRGYYHDMTRTWCFGYAPDEVQAAYDAVMEAYKRSAAACKIGVSTGAVQRLVCEYLESLGHPTVLNTPGTQQGYVHSLAHGIGLNVHEAPWFPTFSDKYTLQAGNVFTLEPGLYYPEKGYGVRVEDSVYLNPAGELETLTDVPYDLVIPMQG